MSELKTPYEIVVLGSISGKAKNSAWENLVKQAEFFRDETLPYGSDLRTAFIAHLHGGEEQFLTTDESCKDKPDLWVKRKGVTKLNKRKYLPSAYRTAKSVASNMLEIGLNFRDIDGNMLGKTQCEKLIKRSKTHGGTLSEYEKAHNMLSKVTKIVKQGHLSSLEGSIIREKAEKLVEVFNESQEI